MLEKQLPASKQSKSLLQWVSLKRKPLFTLTWLILIFFITFLLYQHSLRLGLLSDATFLLEHVSHGLLRSLSWIGNYHYNPIGDLSLYVQYELFKLNDPLYQTFNIAQHALVGFLVFLLGYEYTQSKYIASTASLLFVCASSFYEATLWSIVGTYYTLTSILYIAALISFARYTKTERKVYAWFYSFSAVLAVFSHEFAITLLPVSIAYYLFVGPRIISRNGSISVLFQRQRLLRTLRVLALPGLSLGIFLTLKLLMAQQIEVTAGPSFFTAGLSTLLRGFISSVTFRSKLEFLLSFQSFSGSQWSISPLWIFIGIALFMLLVYVFNPLERFLLLWISGYLLVMALAIGVVSRHLYLPTIASALLVAKISFRFSEWVSKLLTQMIHKQTIHRFLPYLLNAALISLILLGSISDLGEAQELWRKASDIHEKMLDTIKLEADRRPEVQNVFIVNPLDALRKGGYHAWLHWNGLPQSIQMHFPGRFSQVSVVYSMETSRMVAGGTRISQEQLFTTVRNPSNLVLEYYPESVQIRVFPPSDQALTLSYIMITSDTAPILDWQNGAWPYLTILSNESLELPLQNPPQGSAWISLYYLSQPGAKFEIGANREIIAQFDPLKSGEPIWRTANFQMPPELIAGPFSLTIHNRGEKEVLLGRVSLFLPQEIYLKETAPYLNWQEGAWPWLPLAVGDELVLPLPGDLNEEYIVSIHYAHEYGRDLRIKFGDDETTTLSASPGEQPMWRYVQIPVLTTEPEIILTLESTGTIPAMIAKIELIKNPNQSPSEE